MKKNQILALLAAFGLCMALTAACGNASSDTNGKNTADEVADTGTDQDGGSAGSSVTNENHAASNTGDANSTDKTNSGTINDAANNAEQAGKDAANAVGDAVDDAGDAVTDVARGAGKALKDLTN